MDFNQMKYVGRQLYKETRGLEYRYSHISITSPSTQRGSGRRGKNSRDKWRN
jgi:hypothetical protein